MRELYFYHELEDMYEDMLNDCYETIDICGMKYDAGRALRLIDEIAFRCGVSDWCDEEFEEIRYSNLTEDELEHHGISGSQVMYCRSEGV